MTLCAGHADVDEGSSLFLDDLESMLTFMAVGAKFVNALD
jgi:hypothetical protein